MMNKIKLWVSRNGRKYITIFIAIAFAYFCIKTLNNSYKVEREKRVNLYEFNDVSDWDLDVDEPEIFDEETDDEFIEE